MAKKVVIHIFHADKDSLGTSTHVSDRIRQVKDERGVALEVYVFGPAEKALADPANVEIRDTLSSLVKNGVPVHVCRSIAEAMGKELFDFHRSAALLSNELVPVSVTSMSPFAARRLPQRPSRAPQ